jgi:hypothetical protein
MSESGQRPEVGDVAEEAVKLLGALQDWAKQARGEYAEAAGATTAGAAGVVRDLNEHIATGGRDCTYCPLCQAISFVRGTSPEVKEHLTSAAISLLHAAAGLLATTPPDAGRAGSESPIQRIDLDDESDWKDS